ncbi:thiamine transporter 2 [Polymixia lowei]
METVRRWKAGWGYPTTLLCIYGFFSTVKPLEPFLIAYLTGPDKNLTTEQVNNEIFPVWTYSYLSVLVPVFLLTDWLRYKPVVVFQCVNLFVTTALLLWTESVVAMQIMQFFYGVVTASEVAYFSYIYSVVHQEKYRKATSYCRTVQLLGYTVGSVLGQLLVSFNLLSYYYILVFTLVLTAIALLTSCFLPMPQRSMFFHRRRIGTMAQEDPGKHIDEGVIPAHKISLEEAVGRDEKREENGGDSEVAGEQSAESKKGPQAVGPEGSVTAQGCSLVLLQLWTDFLQCYSSRQLLYWSVWWAMATCGYNQTVNYVQVLWEHVQPSQNFTIYNGGVEAVSNLFGAATAYGIGFSQVNWAQWGELALGGFSGLGAAALFLMTFTGNIWVCYSGYIVFKCLYMLLITIAMFQIAVDLSMERYALVFGANNFGALVLQTIITSIVVDSGGLSLAIIPQFTIYASYFSVIAIIFCLRGLFTICRVQKSHKDSPPPKKTSCLPDPDACLEHRL